ncbi:MAG: PIN domain-containing protein, partial [Proteobacteria bacterium]|nr:PIN domain-containing protein [Pseudomonadota bacterium]
MLLEDPDVLVRVIDNKGLPFITNTILDELDYNKKNIDRLVAKNAKAIYRIFAGESSVALATLPNGSAARARDTFRQLVYRNSPVYVVFRRQYAPRADNDARIIEVARDYGMRIITRDQALKVRADCEGVPVDLWTGPRTKERAPSRASARSAKSATTIVRPFEVSKSPHNEPDAVLPVSMIPREG